MADPQEQPLVSIITPSYNQAEFLEDTINSVLAQDYPRLEYMIVDGGSTDGSVEIIQRYAARLAWWTSEKDRGQADAVNKALARAKGSIIAWLNSDDVYRPGAVRAAVAALQAHPEAGLVYGDLDSIDREGRQFNTIRYQQYEFIDLLSFRIIGQPSVFMRADVLQRAGHLDPEYAYLLDHHLWLRMASIAPIHYVPQVWAAARHHAAAKNQAAAARFDGEIFRLINWAESQPTLAGLVKSNSRRVRGGAQRLSARYLLDGGEPAKALRHYARSFALTPLYALQHWRRIVYAVASLFGLGWLRRTSESRQPILVTGLHRSGTTWVGRMLALNGRVAYISEPLNVWHRPGVMRTPVDNWYKYIHSANGSEYEPAIKETLQLDYHLWREVKSLRSLKDFLRMLRDWFNFTRGRYQRRRPLLKDPFAIFSAPWFAQSFGCQVVIVLRHPAAFVSSLKRLGWQFDFNHLLAQPSLMEDLLAQFRPEIEAVAKAPGDVILQGSLLWRIIAHVSRQYQLAYPNFRVVRHEDLSRNPRAEFAQLYAFLGLQFTSTVERKLARATGSQNPDEVSLSSIYATNLDSAANLENWKQRLTADEVSRIHHLTKDAAAFFYRPEEWI
jgi:glycosyltransferase involved in cell wall biosynthesis